MSGIVRLIAAASLCLLALTFACRKQPPNSQQNSNRIATEQKPAKWVAQYRPATLEKFQGVNLGLFSYNSISVVSPSILFVAADVPLDPLGRGAARKAILVRSTDGGESWSETSVEARGLRMTTLNAVHFADAQTGWVAGPDPAQGDSPTQGYVLKTTDSGATWAASKINFKQIPTTIYFADANNGWAGGEGVGNDEEDTSRPSDILATTDGGATWHSQRHLSVSINDFFFLNKTMGWASGYDGAIYNTTDGLSWSSQRSELELKAGPMDVTKGMPPRMRITGIHFVDPQHGWAAVMSDDRPIGVIVGTTNGGATWSRLFIIGDMGVRDVFFLDQNEGWALPTHGPYIYHTTDGGHTWLSENVQFEQQIPLYRLVASDSNHIWAVGGGSIFRRVAQ